MLSGDTAPQKLHNQRPGRVSGSFGVKHGNQLAGTVVIQASTLMKRTMRIHTVLRICLLSFAVSACVQGLDNQVNLDVGDPKTVTISSHCGFETLEIDINGQTWTTKGIPDDDVGNAVEPAWSRGGGEVQMELTLIDEVTLLATEVGSGVAHTYEPDPSPGGCA